MKKIYDAIWINGLLAACEKDYGLIPQGAIAVKNGKIAWVGAMSSLLSLPADMAEIVYDLEGKCLTPGLIDCHTHLIYAGSRANEFEKRLRGETYAAIAHQGGGIQSTVNATRAASMDDLYHSASTRLNALMQSGVTTIEIKSGYGLDWPAEKKMLMVAAKLGASLPVTVCRTFLGAHTIPKEYQNKADAYVDFLCEEMIPAVAQEDLAEAVDVFCESIAFNLAQTERIFKTAKKYHLKIKCHAEQLTNSDCAQLAAKYQALSADHLEYLSSQGAKSMAAAGTIAVLLPGAFYFLQETKKPPVDLLKAHKIPIAIASDCNPGTSPIHSLPLVMNMACILFGLTPEETLLGVTIHAAKALGLEKTHGSLSVGKVADFAIWDIQHPVELIYFLAKNQLVTRVKAGMPVRLA